MDLAVVFESVGKYFQYLCSVKMVFAGMEFSVGALFMWCGIASIFIAFVKGLTS